MQLGAKLPYFELIGCDDQQHSLVDIADRSCVLVIFMCNHCPYVQAYLPRIKALIDRYYEDNLGVILINSNDVTQQAADSFDNMKKLATQYGWENLYWYDEKQEVAKIFGAQRTPEAFLFNSARELVYHGGIDDSWENQHHVTRIWLEDAIEMTLDGVEVDFPETEVVGCTIKWK